MFDVLIGHGRVVDGSGNPWYRADIGVRGGTIAAIGRLDVAVAATTIDASGLVVAPGFIDVHPHSDIMLLAEPKHEPKVYQGVTTELLGQDGLSYAPLSPDNLQMLRWYLAGLNGNVDVGWDWSTVAQFLRRFDGQVAVNVAYLVPHCAPRIEVLGMENRLPTPDELVRMKELVAQGMEDGAVGFSTGLSYAPCCYSDTNELIELCRVVAEYGGIYVTHLRAYGDRVMEAIDEALTVSEVAGVPVLFSHFQATGAGNEGQSEAMLAKIDEARRRGINATLDSYCYLAGSSMLSAILPSWAHEGGPQALMERLKAPASRLRIKEEMVRQPPRWDRCYLCAVASPARYHMEGQSLAALIEVSGKEPVDFLCDLLLEADLDATYLVFAGYESDVRRIMTHHAHMVSTDGLLLGSKPHPRAYGTYPRYLGRYCRELGILTLEDTIRKMTSLPAQTIGLADRGLLKEGLAADIVVFNPDTVLDNATFEDPRQYPTGIEYVLVNGRVVIDKGKHTGVLAGRALKPLLHR